MFGLQLRGAPHEVIDVYPCWKSCWKAVGSVKFSIESGLEKIFFGPKHRKTRLKISHMGRVVRCTREREYTSQ